MYGMLRLRARRTDCLVLIMLHHTRLAQMVYSFDLSVVPDKICFIFFFFNPNPVFLF